MIFHLYCEPLLARHKARPAGDCPALHPAVELEPQVVMQAPRGVLLDDVGVAAPALHLALRLGGHVKTTFGAIGFQSRFATAWHDLERRISRRCAPDRLSDPLPRHRSVSSRGMNLCNIEPVPCFSSWPACLGHPSLVAQKTWMRPNPRMTDERGVATAQTHKLCSFPASGIQSHLTSEKTLLDPRLRGDDGKTSRK